MAEIELNVWKFLIGSLGLLDFNKSFIVTTSQGVVEFEYSTSDNRLTSYKDGVDWGHCWLTKPEHHITTPNKVFTRLDNAAGPAFEVEFTKNVSKLSSTGNDFSCRINKISDIAGNTGAIKVKIVWPLVNKVDIGTFHTNPECDECVLTTSDGSTQTVKRVGKTVELKGFFSTCTVTY